MHILLTVNIEHLLCASPSQALCKPYPSSPLLANPQLAACLTTALLVCVSWGYASCISYAFARKPQLVCSLCGILPKASYPEPSPSPFHICGGDKGFSRCQHTARNWQHQPTASELQSIASVPALRAYEIQARSQSLPAQGEELRAVI